MNNEVMIESVEISEAELAMVVGGDDWEARIRR